MVAVAENHAGPLIVDESQLNPSNCNGPSQRSMLNSAVAGFYKLQLSQHGPGEQRPPYGWSSFSQMRVLRIRRVPDQRAGVYRRTRIWENRTGL